MKRYLWLLSLSVGAFLVSPLAFQPSHNPVVDFKAYLPVVANSFPLVELIITDQGEIVDPVDPFYRTSWVYGYVHSLTTTPVYSVTIGVDVTYFPESISPTPNNPYTRTEIVKPAFPVTLPGEINPFFWINLPAVTNARATIGKVQVVGGNLAGEDTYVPLTVLDWHFLNFRTLEGTVRNDSGLSLVNARVVVFRNQCHWREASLNSTSLTPGQVTDFFEGPIYIEPPYCTGLDYKFVGQGKVEP